MLDPSLPLTVQEYEEWGEPGYDMFVSRIKLFSILFLSIGNACKIILKFLKDFCAIMVTQCDKLTAQLGLVLKQSAVGNNLAGTIICSLCVGLHWGCDTNDKPNAFKALMRVCSKG